MIQIEGGYTVSAYHTLENLSTPIAVDQFEALRQELYNDAIAQYHNNNYDFASKYFKLLSPYLDSKKYLTLMGYDVDEIIKLIGFDNAAERLLSHDSLADHFLKGNWETTDKSYFFSLDTSPSIHYYQDDPIIQSSLPGFKSGDSFKILDGCVSVQELAKIENTEFYRATNSTDLFMLTVIDANTIDAYCFADGNTYTLYRQ